MVEMNKTIITVRFKSNSSKGKFAGIIEERDKRLVKVLDIEETTINRTIIKGLAEMLEFVSDDSDVKAYIQTNVGFSLLNNMIKGNLSKAKKWGNKDVGEKLVEVVLKKNINISFSEYKYNENVEVLKELDDLCENSKSKSTSKSLINQEYSRSNHKIYNENKLAVTDIELIVRGNSNYTLDNRPGMYACILKYGANEKLIKGKLEGLAVNQCIITGIIQAVKLLKRPCNIKLYTQTYVGLAKYDSKAEGPNNELLKELFDLLYTYNHSLEEFIGQYRQKELAACLKGL